ncbi:unnamed protein product [Nesidiocoris tenuis]|uniref:Uncharacterized protein n=1 Tax=Nesidiocoris tenuis TaxID=355587 RepID=A0A6H5FUX2_9HEMI|nr:unnamed protein product [Nesidiocoris tenuis]
MGRTLEITGEKSYGIEEQKRNSNNLTQENTIPWMETRRGAPRCRNPSRAVPSRAIRALRSTSRPDQHGGSFDQPPGTAQQAVGATIPKIYDPRACSLIKTSFLIVLLLISFFKFLELRDFSHFILTKKVSCCGNILWFEKRNTSEYAAGGHRPTRSDAAKHYAIRKSQSKVLLFGILQCFRQLQVIFHTVWRRRVKILILSPPIGDHWRGFNSRSNANPKLIHSLSSAELLAPIGGTLHPRRDMSVTPGKQTPVASRATHTTLHRNVSSGRLQIILYSFFFNVCHTHGFLLGHHLVGAQHGARQKYLI